MFAFPLAAFYALKKCLGAWVPFFFVNFLAAAVVLFVFLWLHHILLTMCIRCRSDFLKFFFSIFFFGRSFHCPNCIYTLHMPNVLYVWMLKGNTEHIVAILNTILLFTSHTFIRSHYIFVFFFMIFLQLFLSLLELNAKLNLNNFKSNAELFFFGWYLFYGDFIASFECIEWQISTTNSEQFTLVLTQTKQNCLKNTNRSDRVIKIETERERDGDEDFGMENIDLFELVTCPFFLPTEKKSQNSAKRLLFAELRATGRRLFVIKLL